jgi:hypothetical protein
MVLLLAVAGLIVVVVRIGLAPSGQLLTISKPEGGTISAAGIRCGSQGTDCSARRPAGDAIELTPQADAGFTFAGYTGDCAPGGRTIMTESRTCGATFVKAVADSAAAGATQLLTIAPVPTGGTLEGVDIICGTKGSICSANHPDGVLVELHPTADPGFTFMGFVGDCVPLGHTQMTVPRTCSATFSPTAEVSVPPPIKPSRAALAHQPPAGAAAAPAVPVPAATAARAAAPLPLTVPIKPQVIVDPSTAGAQKPAAPPPTDEEFAKGKIQETLKAYCDAEEALDPAAIQRLYPKVNMEALKVQLNASKYRSVQCKFGDPVFVSLDAPGGKAKVQAPLKRIYEHTILTEKPQTDELIATITLVRPGPRSPWQIDAATYKPK